jgi:serralysin
MMGKAIAHVNVCEACIILTADSDNSTSGQKATMTILLFRSVRTKVESYQEEKGMSIFGTSCDDNLLGTSGNDEIYGLGGNDTADGSAGADAIYGGSGDDVLYGGTTAGDGYDEEFLAGEGGNDYLLGGNGADRLDGGSSNDVMEGRGGDDTYLVDSTGDRIIDGSGSGVETVEATVSWTLQSGLDHLYLYGSDNINGTGNSFNNIIDGNGGNNVLNGKDGNDKLTGHGGNDTLIGGWGKDIFRFIDPLDRTDTIKDFSVADDTIQIARYNFDSNLTVNSTLNSGRFVVGSSAQDSSDRFIYNKSTGALFFDVDGKGGTGQLKIAQLSSGLSMNHNDIYII